MENVESIYTEYDAGIQQDVSFKGGAVLTILADIHPRVQKALQVIGKKYRHNLTNPSSEITHKVEMEKMVVAVAGWTGVRDREGKEIPYSGENVKKVLTDLPWLLREVQTVVYNMEAFRKEAQAALGEASAPSSEPT